MSQVCKVKVEKVSVEFEIECEGKVVRVGGRVVEGMKLMKSRDVNRTKPKQRRPVAVALSHS